MPDPPPRVPEGAGRVPFVRDRDAPWERLEARFREVRPAGCDGAAAPIAAALATLDGHLAALEDAPRPPGHGDFAAVERALFELGPLFAACPERLAELSSRYERMRRAVKDPSARRDLEDRAARDQVDRLRYGGRMAVEEVMLQRPEGMSATVALRARRLSERHAAVAERARRGAEIFEERHGHRPPYRELVRLAREAAGQGR